MKNNTNTNSVLPLDFSTYSLDELEYVVDCLNDLFRMWDKVETAICDARFNDEYMPMEWADFRNIENAVKTEFKSRP